MQSFDNKKQHRNRQCMDAQKNRPQGASIQDRRPASSLQCKLENGIDNSPKQLAQQQGLQSMFGQPVQRQLDNEELLQGKFDTAQRIEEDELLQGKFENAPVQREAKENNTGLPDQLKSGIEQLSGYSMDNVKVHYNSDKPGQLQAHAYAQGNNIHIAAGQEKHLPHEAWHVVQQRQGRVKPTMQMKAGVNINDDASLETEADVMGAKAVSLKADSQSATRPLVTSGSDTIMRATIQKKGWTWNGATWIPDSGANMPQPPIAGSAVGARYVSMDPETTDDVVADCPNNPLSIGTYNRGRTYAVEAFGFVGHPAHSSNSVHNNPRTRLREMADAGASVAQLREVRRIWGI